MCLSVYSVSGSQLNQLLTVIVNKVVMERNAYWLLSGKVGTENHVLYCLHSVVRYDTMLICLSTLQLLQVLTNQILFMLGLFISATRFGPHIGPSSGSLTNMSCISEMF